jgi:hypothetical protein
MPRIEQPDLSIGVGGDIFVQAGQPELSIGAGGDIFVQAGGSLTIDDATLSGGAVNPGAAGGTAAGAGDLFGSGIFIRGGNNVAFTPGTGETDLISDVISDQNGSLPSASSKGAGGVVLNGPGTLEPDAVNTFTAA